MSLSHLVDDDRTVPAFPLGQPYDGTPRYGMTAEQARFYRWIVANRTRCLAFNMDFRQIARVSGEPLSQLHNHASALVERGWLRRIGRKFAFVQPVMQFEARR